LLDGLRWSGRHGEDQRLLGIALVEPGLAEEEGGEGAAQDVLPVARLRMPMRYAAERMTSSARPVNQK
jgi:hypothetical protein